MAALGAAKLLSRTLVKVSATSWVPAALPFPPVNWSQIGKLASSGGTPPPTTGQIWP